MTANAPEWGTLRAQTVRRLRERLPFASEGTLQDLALEVQVMLFRLSRREPLTDAAGLSASLEQRVAADHIRRLRGSTGRLDPVSTADTAFEPAGVATGLAASTDMLELFRFLVLQQFHELDAPCEELAKRFYASQSWSAVSEELGLRPQTAIKRWTVCMGQVRKRLQSQRGAVWDWARAVVHR